MDFSDRTKVKSILKCVESAKKCYIDKDCIDITIFHEKTCFLHMQKQRFRSAALNRAADQRLCFGYIDSNIPSLHKSDIFCGCTAMFLSDLVGNQEDRFSHDTAHICSCSV